MELNWKCECDFGAPSAGGWLHAPFEWDFRQGWGFLEDLELICPFVFLVLFAFLPSSVAVSWQ